MKLPMQFKALLNDFLYTLLHPLPHHIEKYT
jgi:hypothetical protein